MLKAEGGIRRESKVEGRGSKVEVQKEKRGEGVHIGCIWLHEVAMQVIDCRPSLPTGCDEGRDKGCDKGSA